MARDAAAVAEPVEADWSGVMTMGGSPVFEAGPGVAKELRTQLQVGITLFLHLL
ncbi:MAG: hypothetical protein ACTHJH_06510 [Marmoricola sp.]